MDIVSLGRSAAEKVEQLISDYDHNGHGIPDSEWWEKQDIPDKKSLLRTMKSSIYDSEVRASTIEGHWKALRRLYTVYLNEIPYASNQLGFRYAYQNLVKTEIHRSETRKLRNLGANLIPVDPAARKPSGSSDVHTVFRTTLRGIANFDWGSKKFV